MELTAARTAFTFLMTKASSLPALLAPGSGSSSCSRYAVRYGPSYYLRGHDLSSLRRSLYHDRISGPPRYPVRDGDFSLLPCCPFWRLALRPVQRY